MTIKVLMVDVDGVVICKLASIISIIDTFHSQVMMKGHLSKSQNHRRRQFRSDTFQPQAAVDQR